MNKNKKEKIRIIFFGSPEFAVDVLSELKKEGILFDSKAKNIRRETLNPKNSSVI